MFMLVIASIIDWKASVPVITPAKPQIAATVIVIGTESTAPLLSIPTKISSAQLLPEQRYRQCNGAQQADIDIDLPYVKQQKQHDHRDKRDY